MKLKFWKKRGIPAITKESFQLTWRIHGITREQLSRIVEQFGQACRDEGATISMGETIVLPD